MLFLYRSFQGLLLGCFATAALSAQAQQTLPRVLQNIGRPLTRSITSRYNPLNTGVAVVVSPERKYWWAGLDSAREVYGQHILGNLFLQRVDYDPIGSPHPEFDWVYRGSMQVVKMEHLGRGRGAALLLAHRGVLQLGTQSVQPRDPQGINYALAWMNEQGRCTRLRALPCDDAFALTADTAGQAYVSFSRARNTFINRYSLSGDSLLQITNTNTMLLSNLAVTPAGEIVAIGGCMDAGARVGGLAVADSIFTYTSFIAGYSAQGEGRWVHTIKHVTCPQERLMALPEGVVWVGQRIEDLWILGQPLPHAGTFFDGFFSATFNPVTGALITLVSGPDSGRLASIDPGSQGFSPAARAGADLTLRGSPSFYGFRLADSATPYTQSTHMALHSGSLFQGEISSAQAAPLYVTGRSVYGLASALSDIEQQYGALVGVVSGTDTLRVYNGWVDQTYPVAAPTGAYTLYMLPYGAVIYLGVQKPKTAPLLLAPNPASESVRWTTMLGEPAEAILRNTLGQAVQQVRLSSGAQELSLDASLPAGLYTLQIRTSTQAYQGRFLKL